MSYGSMKSISQSSSRTVIRDRCLVSICTRITLVVSLYFVSVRNSINQIPDLDICMYRPTCEYMHIYIVRGLLPLRLLSFWPKRLRTVSQLRLKYNAQGGLYFVTPPWSNAFAWDQSLGEADNWSTKAAGATIRMDRGPTHACTVHASTTTWKKMWLLEMHNP